MQVGAVSFRPYIYNTNAVSSASMNKISAIGNDALASKTDISALTSKESKASSAEVLNPLKRGESLDFAGIVQMQMQMSRLNADRVMVPQKEEADPSATQKITEAAQSYENNQAMSNAMGFNVAV